MSCDSLDSSVFSIPLYIPEKIAMTYEQLNIFDYLDIDDFTVDELEPPSPRGKGRPPRVVKNPLDGVEPSLYMNSEGRPRVWIDDCLMGAIRAFGEKDQRETTRNNYVSLNKVFRVLCSLRGDLTRKRIEKALGVNHDTAWRILSVIDFASWSIERCLNAPSRIMEYQNGFQRQSSKANIRKMVA